MNGPTGCTTLTFGAAPTVGSISSAAEMDCFTFSGSAGDRVRIRMVKTSGTGFSPTQEEMRPNGTTKCTPTGALDVTCALDYTGTHTILIEDSAGTNTGGYVVSVQLLNNPTGCTTLTIGAAVTSSSITANGQMKCFRFTDTAGDVVHVKVNDSGALTAVQETMRPNGTSIAGPTAAADQQLTVDTDGTYTIIVEDSAGTNSGGFNIQVTH